MRIHRLSLSGSLISIVVILISPYAKCMANFVLKRATVGIPAHFTGYIEHSASKAPSTKKKRKPQKYDTPTQLGVKWQLDVKYVPSACYVGEIPDKFYQYTMIDEASRERFIYPYREQSSYSTIDFVKRAINYFRYSPETIQTDNGFEFTYPRDYKRTHSFDIFCNQLEIQHKLIRPRTPWHNGKVERSHRNDQERFYNFLSFYSFEDLKVQMYRYMRRSNRIPMAVLGWISPIERRSQLQA